MSLPKPAPADLLGTLRHLGPGLIVTASIVGSGELIVTPKLGADVGFHLLWFIIMGCVIKVFVQIELGRFAIARGMTTLEAMNTIPGPRWRVSWLLWFWLVMYVALVFQVAGIVGGIAQVFSVGGAKWSDKTWATIVAASCALLLAWGRYSLVENLSTVMVAAFTICTVIAVTMLPWTPYRISAANIWEGLQFHVPASFTTAFAAFGIIGVGASELIYYPYWCLEKGYAKNVGPREDSPAWVERVRGWVRVMRLDAWFSMVIYTGATVAFYLLGAAVLHGKGLSVTNNEMIPTLSHMYRESFGAWGMWIFLIGAFNVLYSTVFVATASNARLFADAAALFGVLKYETPEQRLQTIRWACVGLPALSLGLYLLWGAPVSLVLVGALAQGVMLPFLGLVALYFRYRQTQSELQPGRVWSFFLWLAALAMGAVGLHQVTQQLGKFLK
ncbi:MAG: Nramp family divalent metal transporter [Chloroflexi bacterium]|nr:Nramp family divalent metal transporter [Chloroflexota bacterium]